MNQHTWHWSFDNLYTLVEAASVIYSATEFVKREKQNAIKTQDAKMNASENVTRVKQNAIKLGKRQNKAAPVIYIDTEFVIGGETERQKIRYAIINGTK